MERKHQRERAREREGDASKTDPLFTVTIHFNGEFVGSCCQTSSTQWLGTAAHHKNANFRMRRESAVARRQPASQTMAARTVRCVGRGIAWKVSPLNAAFLLLVDILLVDIGLLIRMKKGRRSIERPKAPRREVSGAEKDWHFSFDSTFFPLHKRMLLYVLSKE